MEKKVQVRVEMMRQLRELKKGNPDWSLEPLRKVVGGEEAD